jgi:phosphatidylglycerophosphatase A
MKTTIERRKPDGPLDYAALTVTTFGVGYLPIMPGTYGSAVGVVIYLAISSLTAAWLAYSGPFSEPIRPFLSGYPTFGISEATFAWVHVIVLVSFLMFCLLGIWAAGRSTELLGNSDPSEAVVDEVIGQLITFLFVPFGISWPFILAGFLLFRLFDIWKPYPIDSLQVLPGGIGVCADDILAGVYAGICLSVIYAVSLSI